ncbi:MAG TPA: nucleotidyl transferase AbiEii/AbiGii toxin family protein [Gammaproteobacteria bacterium]|nr:nucleotidyl transferase AbiEii/AbiGii toxin family protein [Gammaproteobacteria bacterium]
MMSEIENFNSLVDRAMRIPGYARMRPAVAKELLHYDVLFCLDKEGLLDNLTFQGGTALRLCYGAPRFSEDLDFVGGLEFATASLIKMKNCLEKCISRRYGLEILVKEPKEMASISKYQDIKVDKWQISIVTSPERKDIPKQKIKIEVVNIPTYSRVPQSLRQNYEFLPDGYGDTLIMTETLDEIMADKLISLVSCQRYVRYRDIWDLRWLKQQGAGMNAEYILAKIRDYKENDYLAKLKKMINQLDEIVRSKEFQDEMSRFIPIDILEHTLRKEKFIDFLISENKLMLLQVEKIIDLDAEISNA